MTIAERWEDLPEIIGIEDIMRICGCGRPTATRIANMKGCPTLPRVGREHFKIPKDAFFDFWTNYTRGQK